MLAPHCRQNWSSGRQLWPHWEQCATFLILTRRREAKNQPIPAPISIPQIAVNMYPMGKEFDSLVVQLSAGAGGEAL